MKASLDDWENAHGKIRRILTNKEVWTNHHEEALANFENNYTPLKNREQVIDIYKKLRLT